MPDGTFVLEDDDFLTRLHEGDATVGWIGDPWLYMAYNKLDNRIEIWRHCEDGVPRMIMRSKPGVRVLDTAVLKFLAEHDSQSRRKYDAHEETVRHNDALTAANNQAYQAKMVDVYDRLRMGMKRDGSLN